MSLRVNVEDLETGEKIERVLPDGDYFILATSPCWVDGIQTYPTKGTHVITVKGHAPATAPHPAAPGANGGEQGDV
jgi:hypothetical protein